MPLSDKEKFDILRLIEPNISLLFGNTSSSLTKESKQEAWRKICADCQQIHGFNAVPDGKDFTYLRDVIWPNLKRTSIKAKKNDPYKFTENSVNRKVYSILSQIEAINNEDGHEIMEGRFFDFLLYFRDQHICVGETIFGS